MFFICICVLHPWVLVHHVEVDILMGCSKPCFLLLPPSPSSPLPTLSHLSPLSSYSSPCSHGRSPLFLYMALCASALPLLSRKDLLLLSTAVLLIEQAFPNPQGCPGLSVLSSFSLCSTHQCPHLFPIIKYGFKFLREVWPAHCNQKPKS